MPVDEEKEEYSIEASVKEVGILYPVILDAHDNVIDGYHRLELHPQWPAFKLEHIKTKPQLLMARIIANIHRRQVSAEEKTEWLSVLAEETGWTPRQIADKLGMSYSWVMKYLPDRFKERPGAGPSEYPVTRRVTQEAEAVSIIEKPAKPLTGKEETVIVESSKKAAGQTGEGEKKLWRCHGCMEKYGEPIRPTNFRLCPDCAMEFSFWKVEKGFEEHKRQK